jgi:hypothetical protein
VLETSALAGLPGASASKLFCLFVGDLMNNKTNLTAIFASSVATMLVACASKNEPTSSPAPTATNTSALDQVRCEGINTCKGTSECQSADGKSGCQGLNACNGQGWITVSRKECEDKKGKVLTSAGNNVPPTPSATVTAGPSPTGVPTTVPTTIPTTPPPSTGTVKCTGTHSCKGNSDCKGAGNNSCKGLNECAPYGFVFVASEADCTAKGGKVLN